MPCECQTGQRVLRITCDTLSELYPELQELASPKRWQFLDGDPSGRSGHHVLVTIGGGSAWQSATEVVNFLRTILPEARLKALMGAWLPPSEAPQGSAAVSCCGGGCSAAIDEKPLTELIPLDASPLVRLLQNKRIETWFQPIFRAGTHELWGHECLMRAKDQDGSIINPGQLLQWAEQERLIFMLDRICRETHIENAAKSLPGNTSILINFLPTAIYDPSFCLRTTRTTAKQHALDPARVIFEVVESERVVELDHLREILDYYREGGFRTALDDVGSGYAGLTMLAELAPDLIKIDRGLVQRAAQSKMHRIICNALVEIARQSRKLCLAEGIENQEEYDVMRGMGVDLVQGYYFGKPAVNPAFTVSMPSDNKTRLEKSSKPSAA